MQTALATASSTASARPASRARSQLSSVWRQRLHLPAVSLQARAVVAPAALSLPAVVTTTGRSSTIVALDAESPAAASSGKLEEKALGSGSLTPAAASTSAASHCSTDTTLQHTAFGIGELCDLCLVVEQKCFHVHRLTLSYASPIFRNMFTNGMQETTVVTIPLPGKRALDVKTFLQAVYRHEEVCLLPESSSSSFSAALCPSSPSVRSPTSASASPGRPSALTRAEATAALTFPSTPPSTIKRGPPTVLRDAMHALQLLPLADEYRVDWMLRECEALLSTSYDDPPLWLGRLARLHGLTAIGERCVSARNIARIHRLPSFYAQLAACASQDPEMLSLIIRTLIQSNEDLAALAVQLPNTLRQHQSQQSAVGPAACFNRTCNSSAKTINRLQELVDSHRNPFIEEANSVSL